MDPDENQEPQIPKPSRIHISSFLSIFNFSILILFIAISFSIIAKTPSFRNYLPKPTISPYPNLFQNLLNFLRFTPMAKQNEFTEPPYCVLWMAPFLSGGGYSSEAWSYISALNNYIKKQMNPVFKLSIEHHGDQENVEFWEGLPLEMRNLAIQFHQTECRLNSTIVICHSEPGAWYPPLFQTLPCPPTGYGKYKIVIGRTMFETDRVNVEHVRRCNRMDQVWVPTDFHVDTFIQSGFDPMKVRKIVQPVDLEFFDPSKVKPLDLASVGSSLVLGSDNLNSKNRFVFLSIFKWEYRKGWDVLLRSYLKEFSAADNVALYMLTNAYHSDRDFGNKIVEYVKDSDLEEPVNVWAPIYVVGDHIAQVDLPRLYMAANAFVLPSRGEGWGRPIVEAMAMSLPVITTNWSGPTEYLTDENSYPLSFEGMSEVKEGPFKGHLWAEPSVDKLQLLMRHVMSDPDEAKHKGLQARVDMMRRFSPEIVGEDIINLLQLILENLD
ncbi:Mannosylfructose-phosphate synthase [Handroanthus impetiginosus]|uniref:Mannosylfructose-phosphate synthase n=1 Tax=Handroanthus impetiginosus TaxID=429701 RepID=A0A2G9HLX9_9LAMI|nr:Mannosylfructose-phosphate synthase [Handroanthus impetiginosus]